MMETYYNTYDKDGNFKRKILSNKVKTDLKEDEYLQGVSCIIIKDKKILFEKRSTNQDGGNLMDFCSGHIDNDENPETAMIRELQEELGISKEIANKITKLKRYPVIVERRQTQKNWHMTIFYLKIPDDLELQIQESEIKKIIFLPFEEAFELIQKNKELQFPYDNNMKEILEQLKTVIK